MDKRSREALYRIYDAVPSANCKGLCQEQCSIIPYEKAEEENMLAVCGKVPVERDMRCSLLTKDGKCSIYRHRPLICRLWGVVDHGQMICPHGCKPDEGFMSDSDAVKLLVRLRALSEIKKPWQK